MSPDPGVNASPEPLLKNSDLYNVNEHLPEDERGTYRTGKKQLDYIIVSSALKNKLSDVCIDRKGIYTRNGNPYPTVTSRRTEASDHGAVVALFAL